MRSIRTLVHDVAMAVDEKTFTFSGVLRNKIAKQGKSLELELQKTRETLDHRGAKGDLNEIAFREFLREHLPPQLRVGTGEVVDTHGRRSLQTDVAIADEEQP